MSYVTALTIVHVIISLLGIGSGFVVIYGMWKNQRMEGWTKLFLATTIATSLTGFIFPFEGFKPSYVLGVLSLIALGIAVYARYVRQMTGSWRWMYAVTAIVSQYFNVFVLVAQGFAKIPALKSLAPTQSEPPFAIAQGIVLGAFFAIGYLSLKRFKPQPVGGRRLRVSSSD
jgi:hypothetical protein